MNRISGLLSYWDISLFRNIVLLLPLCQIVSEKVIKLYILGDDLSIEVLRHRPKPFQVLIVLLFALDHTGSIQVRVEDEHFVLAPCL